MKKAMFTLLVILFPLFSLQSHPHMSIHYSCDFHFEENELKGAWVNFAFDRFFSVDITSGYDLDGDAKFDREETEIIYENAFINLEKYGFFISIRDMNGRTSPLSVSQFTPYLDDEDFLNYRFYIELDDTDARELYLSIYDPTFFCATFMAEADPVEIVADPPHQTSFEVVENTDYPVFYDPYAPASDTTTHDKWRPGLNTYFPEEIHLVY